MKAPPSSASSSAPSAAGGGGEPAVFARGSVGVVRHGLGTGVHAARLSDAAARAILTMLFSDPDCNAGGGGCDGGGAAAVAAAYQPPKGHQRSASQAEPTAYVTFRLNFRHFNRVELRSAWAYACAGRSFLLFPLKMGRCGGWVDGFPAIFGL